MNKKILFIDDNPNVLQGIKRSLRGQRQVWDMAFATSGNEAIDMIEKSGIDMIVSDVKMPGMNGAELLEWVARNHPQVIRLVLSGHTDNELALRLAGVAHQYLTKPCATESLINTINKTFRLRSYLKDESLYKIMNGLKTLPSQPNTYHQIVTCLQSETASLEDISEIINSDPAMLAKTMQLVNSAFFGLGRRITNSRDALSIIGVDAIKALTLTIGIFTQFDTNSIDHDTGYSVTDLLHRSLAVAQLAERIAKTENLSKTLSDDCFLAGMLHAIGILILRQILPDEFYHLLNSIKQSGKTLIEAETEHFGTNHDAIAAYILGLWGLPNALIEALAFHTHPSKYQCEVHSPLVIVHAADVLLHEHQNDSIVTRIEIDDACSKQSIFQQKMEVWRELLSKEPTK
jgi:HD-like signal output (HDOD) protein